jgi:beta-ribofuranosylaminobenzene 5'-phosphate synthase
MNGKKPLTHSQNCAITVSPRLHITLIGMNSDGYRQNGGIGFCVSKPQAKVHVSIASSFSLRDSRQCPLQAAEHSLLTKIAQDFAGSPVQIEISGEMPSHYGFGSSTSIRLATLEAIATVMGKTLDRSALIKASRRGGTSGIGITTYFDGGLVFDVGVKKDVCHELLPSSALEGTRPPPLIVAQIKMPAWKIGLCIPYNIPPQTEEQELAFFKRVCPTPAVAINETLYHVVYGAVASASEHDFDGFCNALSAIQNCTWKRLERELYGQQLVSLERKIYDSGARAVGMSSLGPGLFFLADDVDVVITGLKAALPEHSWMAGVCDNTGRNVIFK